ncbi:MAG: MFS transporter [Stellaceae bacterium]
MTLPRSASTLNGYTQHECFPPPVAGIAVHRRAVQHGLRRLLYLPDALYGLSLGLDASKVGILVGARSLVAMFLSIHIGVLMDRFGTRKVTLVFVWTGMALAPLFPLVPWFWALLLLQLVNGAAVSFAWSGAQTLIAQLTEGDTRYLGRFTFFARLG